MLNEEGAAQTICAAPSSYMRMVQDRLFRTMF